MRVDNVKGVIVLADGSTTEFMLFANGGDGGWTQWGTVGRPGDFVDTLDALLDGAVEHYLFVDDPDEEDDPDPEPERA